MRRMLRIAKMMLDAVLLRPAAYRGAASSLRSPLMLVLAIYGFLAFWTLLLEGAPPSTPIRDLVGFLVLGLLRWLLVAGLLWFVAVHGFNGEGSYAAVLPAAALAHTPLLLQALPLPSEPTSYFAAAWFVLALAVAAHATLAISRAGGAGTALMAAAGLLVVSNVFLVPVSIVTIL